MEGCKPFNATPLQVAIVEEAVLCIGATCDLETRPEGTGEGCVIGSGSLMKKDPLPGRLTHDGFCGGVPILKVGWLPGEGGDV